MIRSVSRSFSVLALLIPFLAGCSSGAVELPAAPVEGVVRLKGKPVADAQVWFNPEKGPSSFARTDAQGHYSLAVTVGERPGALVGSHQVRVVTGIPAPPKEVDTNKEIALPPPTPQFEYTFSAPTAVTDKGNVVDLDLDTATKRGA